MSPYTKHNLKWAIPIIFIRLPLSIILQTFIWMGQYAEYLGDHLMRIIPGFERDYWKYKKKAEERYRARRQKETPKD